MADNVGDVEREPGDGRLPHVFIRFPLEMLTELKAAAVREHRSLSGQIRHVVEIGMKTMKEMSRD